MMQSPEYAAFLMEKARSRHTEMLLRQLLELRTACVHGVTAREATEWLELPPGKASETSVGIMLRTMGYKRYRRRIIGEDGKGVRAPNGKGWLQECRLFPSETPPRGWTR